MSILHLQLIVDEDVDRTQTIFYNLNFFSANLISWQVGKPCRRIVEKSVSTTSWSAIHFCRKQPHALVLSHLYIVIPLRWDWGGWRICETFQLTPPLKVAHNLFCNQWSLNETIDPLSMKEIVFNLLSRLCIEKSILWRKLVNSLIWWIDASLTLTAWFPRPFLVFLV